MTGGANKGFQSDRWPDGAGMVYFGMSPWQGMWKSRHQLMSRFSSELPVLYVEPWVGLRSLRTGRTRLTRIATDAVGKRTERLQPDITIFHSPAYLPVSTSPKLARVTQKLWMRAIRRAMRRAGISKPIVWICKPEMQFVLDQLDELFSIYHVVDEYAGYTGTSLRSRGRLAAQETAVLDRVDLVIVASPELAEVKRGKGRELLIAENGVEPREYERARQSDSEPEDLAAIEKPRIGYSGLIGKRLDLELIRDLALRRPGWSVVMIGKIDERECEDAIEALRSMPNVHLLGEKRPDEVADYIVSFDVGLLPYTINLETEHISPIKMYEYWAAGIPVVSTAIPAAQRHSFAVNVAGNGDEFVAMVNRLLENPSDDESGRLVELASSHSWQSRVDGIAADLGSRIGAC